MKLSERRINAALYRIECGMRTHKNDATCVAMAYRQLEAELEQRRTQIALLQPVYLEVCEENEALKKLAQHGPECPYSPQMTRGTHADYCGCTCGLVALLTGEASK